MKAKRNALPPPGAADKPSSLRCLAAPAAFALALSAFAALPSVRASQTLLLTFTITPGLLLAWTALLFVRARARPIRWHFVLRRPHWLQPLVQGSVYIYWGLAWPEVFHSAHFILAQILFAYAFDMLLFWSRSEDYELGLGPLPIIFSINLFLWFRPDWFYWQFVLVAAGFAAKQLFRWQKDGRSAHIFNPSSFPLAIASLLLIATGTAGHTWGEVIATTIGYPEHIFEYLFVISLPGQLLFGVAAMTMPAVFTAWLLGAVYFAFTGSYYYFGTIPTAAFLGMLLLFTDPATAPKSEAGRILYGVLYGLSVFVLYGLLETFGQPSFYDKLLLVPALNLSVQWIDRLASSPRLRALLPDLTGRKRHAAWTAAWAGAFVMLLSLHGVGDTHPANRLPYWQAACDQKLRNGCHNLGRMELTFCNKGAPWACNEIGIRASVRTDLTPEKRREVEEAAFDRGCALGMPAACANHRAFAAGQTSFQTSPPLPADYEIMLESKGLPRQHSNLQLAQWACQQGWKDGCDKVARLTGGMQLEAGGGVVEQLERACSRGDQNGCRSLAVLYRTGDGVPQDPRRAMACELGVVEGCLSAHR